MAIYKNLSNTVKTFHGVTFNPGDVKEVPGIINHNQFIRVKSVPKEPPKQTESKQKESAHKSEPKPQKKSEPKPAQVTETASEVQSDTNAESEIVESLNKEE